MLIKKAKHRFGSYNDKLDKMSTTQQLMLWFDRTSICIFVIYLSDFCEMHISLYIWSTFLVSTMYLLFTLQD